MNLDGGRHVDREIVSPPEGPVPDTVFGLPLHPLVIHAVVVLVPLAALGAFALAGVPRWRRAYGWPVLALATVALLSVPVATRTGEQLKASLTLGGPVLDKVARHQQLGGLVIWAVLPLWALLLALVLAHRSGQRPGVEAVAAWLAALAGVAATVLVVLAGHAGATAVWNPAG